VGNRSSLLSQAGGSAGLLTGDVHRSWLTKAHTNRFLSWLAPGGYSPVHRIVYRYGQCRNQGKCLDTYGSFAV